MEIVSSEFRGTSVVISVKSSDKLRITQVVYSLAPSFEGPKISDPIRANKHRAVISIRDQCGVSDDTAQNLVDDYLNRP